MRLRHIPGSENELDAAPEVIKHAYLKKGKWSAAVFGNNQPLHIEIGMGKGQFLRSLAPLHPEINYVGIDRYSSVLLKAVERMEREEKENGTDFDNLRLLCMDARSLTDVFSPGEVDGIYLNFSDPWPKKRHAHRRLTSDAYLALYDQILSAGAFLEFKTDDRNLFDYSLERAEASPAFEITAATFDLHQDAVLNRGNVPTEYEEKFSSMDHPICKMILRKIL